MTMVTLTHDFRVDESTAQDYWTLLKPRVMSLVVFTAIVGLLLAPGEINPIIALSAILCVAVGSGAAGAINMWYDRDIDAIMERTQERPLPTGKISPDSALFFGVFLSLMSVMTMAVVVGVAASLYLAAAILFYVFVYTIWLKRSTPQNIVIGGAAGAFPPLIGWVSVTGSSSLEAWVLFAIIFMWTPPHFWALSLYKCQDYARANVPMLPVVAGIQATKTQIVLYSVLMIGTTFSPYFMGFMGPIYGFCALVLNLIFLSLSIQVKISDEKKHAVYLFVYSIFYLFLLFLAMLIDHKVYQ